MPLVQWLLYALFFVRCRPGIRHARLFALLVSNNGLLRTLSESIHSHRIRHIRNCHSLRSLHNRTRRNHIHSRSSLGIRIRNSLDEHIADNVHIGMDHNGVRAQSSARKRSWSRSRTGRSIHSHTMDRKND